VTLLVVAVALLVSTALVGLVWQLARPAAVAIGDERAERLARLVEAFAAEDGSGEPPAEVVVVGRRIEVRVPHTLNLHLAPRGADDPDTAVTGLRTDFDRDYTSSGEDRLLLSRTARDLVERRLITVDASHLRSGGDVVSLAGLRSTVADVRALHGCLHGPVPAQLADIIRSGDDVAGRRQALERLLRDHPEEEGRLEGFAPPPELAIVLHLHHRNWDALETLFQVPRLREVLRLEIMDHLAPDVPRMLAIAPTCAPSPTLSAAWFARIEAADPRVPAGLRELLRPGLLPKERSFQAAAAVIVVEGALRWVEGDVPLLLMLLGLVEPKHRQTALNRLATCATMDVEPTLREAARTRFLSPKAVEAALDTIRARAGGQEGSLSLVDPIAGEVSLATGGGTLREPDAEPS
jgi:hypothetical protein